jgi:hypothetical protein
MTEDTDTNALKPCEERDGIDVAIIAFIGTQLTGGSIEEATRHAEAMLDIFGIEREPKP